MGFWQNLFRASKPARQLAAPAIRARFDAAESLDDRRHWANSDWLSLDGALTPVVRRTLRNRARYERLNNSYLAGICETLAFDLIG
ncbi:MAG: hypothetical protein EBQ89_00515, partial [Alphaproteobacteria bacterium]|nr:hypothetical protein [Alphaproteobacteria bacterium]